MQKVICRMKKKFKEWQSIKNVKIRLAYIEAKRGEKRVVSKAKASKYEEMCSRQYSK